MYLYKEKIRIEKNQEKAALKFNGRHYFQKVSQTRQF